MAFGLRNLISRWITKHLMKEDLRDPNMAPMYDFDRLCYELRPGDVLLTEGCSHVAEVIKLVTQSPWTHSVLYLGRLYDIEDPEVRQKLKDHYDGDPNEQLILEALMGEGIIITPLKKYKDEHIRICRPKGLSPHDAQKVIGYGINKIGLDYDVRHILDLMRFMFPYSFLPRRWRSTLFAKNAGEQTRTVCSTMMAEAFHSVRFPILPFAEKTEDGSIHLYQRNPRLYTPKDFDYSPYFEIIKFPFFGLDDVSIYKRLPWKNEDLYCNDLNDCYLHTADKEVEQLKNSELPQFKTVKMNKDIDKQIGIESPTLNKQKHSN